MCSSNKKIITFHGDVETTSFFMTQIEKQLKKDGYDVHSFYFNAENKIQNETNTKQFLNTCLTKREKTKSKGCEYAVFLTFNFAGIYGDDLWLAEAGTAVVDKLNLTVINIIVDHPYHYHAFMQEQLLKRPDRYYQICIDKKHQEYMHRYFPQIKQGPFLPTGGTGFFKKTPFSVRPVDVIFTGTYMRPESFEVFINRNGKEYADFYHRMIEEAYSNPQVLLEDVVRRSLQEEIPEVTEEEIKETLGHIQFLDYYIRFKRRGEVIRTLVDAGIKVHVIGSGWDTLECVRPENLEIASYLTSEECLEQLAEAKLSLNILPCFHEGGHDRIFNSMLCGAVCVTDSNAYLDTILKDGENALVYSHEDLQSLAERIKNELAKEKTDATEKETRSPLAEIADKGYELAKANHTWADRTKGIEQFLKEISS